MHLVQSLWDGLVLGGTYAASSLGFMLVWTTTKAVNLSHGALIMLGAYVTYWLFTLTGLDPFASIPVSMLALFVLGYGLQRILLNRVASANAPVPLLLSFALGLLIMALAANFFTTDFRSIETAYTNVPLHLGGTNISLAQGGTLLAVLALAVGQQVFLGHTRAGNALRVTARDPQRAQMAGVDLARVYSLTFAIGAASAGAAGSLISINFSIAPNISVFYTFIAFVVCAVGGVGSIKGVVLGGLLLGLLQSLTQPLVGPSLQNALAVGLLVAILILRPAGLLGQRAS